MTMIKYPLVTEKTTSLMENSNALQFITDIDATKKQIATEIEDMYGVKVKRVNTMVAKGKKKAVVSFEEKGAAGELASRLGVF